MRAHRRSVGQALAGACGRRLEGRHLSTNYIHYYTYREFAGRAEQRRNTGCRRLALAKRRNTPILYRKVALRGIANYPQLSLLSAMHSQQFSLSKLSGCKATRIERK